MGRDASPPAGEHLLRGLAPSEAGQAGTPEADVPFLTTADDDDDVAAGGWRAGIWSQCID